jgi:hypothetical protein
VFGNLPPGHYIVKTRLRHVISDKRTETDERPGKVSGWFYLLSAFEALMGHHTTQRKARCLFSSSPGINPLSVDEFMVLATLPRP